MARSLSEVEVEAICAELDNLSLRVGRIAERLKDDPKAGVLAAESVRVERDIAVLRTRLRRHYDHIASEESV
ncbi:MAG: hypothetical protein HYZ57_03620 [Acidobacteria bacterium]|nr:hypothetical protein [Acidobacteriota bacterium]MBI3278914.1 hypothetical protein [Acidobacteriota bacterium]